MDRPNYFVADATIERDGVSYLLTLAEQNALVTTGNYWHTKGNPSSWLAVATFEAARRKYPKTPNEVTLELAALALGIDSQALISAIQWHENYMRWHDGDPDYSVL